MLYISGMRQVFKSFIQDSDIDKIIIETDGSGNIKSFEVWSGEKTKKYRKVKDINEK